MFIVSIIKNETERILNKFTETVVAECVGNTCGNFMLEKRLGANSTWLKSQSTQDKVESEYKELWSILKRAYRKVGKVQNEDENNDYKYTVQNTLRRIYESFFFKYLWAFK